MGAVLSEWISVKDQLPELEADGMSKTVLVCGENGKRDLGFATNINRVKTEIITSSWKDSSPDRVAYWMPLPAPPEEKQ